MIQDFPNTSQGLTEAEAVSNPKHIWIDGEIIRVFTGEDIPQVTPAVLTVSRRQMFLALHQLGYLTAVQNWRNTQATETQGIEFDAAGTFASDWPTLIQAATALGLTELQRIAVFQLAQTL